ncbi:hypothetical protein SaccyDRAFT_3767 [Saccharomonospora cyanea NA-134]|uniref:Secreted protein n=2 Tax=Saccharomonospora cyanea TaxID=40989 RepID=H5XFH1_9PSEU|nr:hypothetical protein SaccyDRAFT_3767 [Saccharomonospora cyanea NA-134]
MIIGMSLKRTVALSLTGVLTAIVTALTAGGAATAAEPLPDFDFSDCPALPTGADPAQWRCEVLVSTGTLSFGNLSDVPLEPMRLTFAERWTGGPYEQEFGALRSEPTPLPGLPGTSLRFRYGGYSDFQSNDERKGEIDLVAALEGPFLPRGCAIGTQADPIHSVLQQPGPTEVVSSDPLVLRFDSIDEQLAMPAVSGCGPWRGLLDHRLGLPSASGENVLEQQTYVAIRHYG